MMQNGDFPNTQEIELVKKKFAATTRLGRQLLKDTNIKKIDVLEGVVDDLLFALETRVFAHDDGTAEQEVYVDVEVGVSWRQILSFLFGGKRTVKERVPVKVKAQKWTMFPENNIAFPPGLGGGVVKVQTRVGDE